MTKMPIKESLRLYNTTSQLCSEICQKIENPENTQSCRQFAQETMISLKVEPVVDLATPLVGWPTYYSLLSEQAKKNPKDIDQIKIRTTLLEQTLFFEVLLNQYAYETQILLAIIDSALHGKLHTSILHTQRWLTELREIKANLPIGTTFLLEIKTESISDFIKISEITVCHKGQYLIFVTKIPLVQTIDFNAYKVIPLPIIYDSQSLILINPSMEIIAISYVTQKFLTLTNKQWEMCREVLLLTPVICKTIYKKICIFGKLIFRQLKSPSNPLLMFTS
ncbi:hypothetical protein QTP88_023794 [Uroleucon formosanum]